jgi:hypothetical protein
MRTDGQIDVHDEANSRFSGFCERAKQEGKILRWIFTGVLLS